jgi:RNA polymerase primary sigma factor
MRRDPRRQSERALVAAAQAGDSSARDELVARFMPAIGHVAYRYRNARGITRAELVQEGVVGLLHAVEQYDLQATTPFWGYASWWVRRAMQQLVAQLVLPVALSDRGFRKLARIKAAHREHMRAHGREPSTSQLAAGSGLTIGEIADAVAAERVPCSLHQQRSDGPEAGTWEELVVDPASESQYEQVMDGLGSVAELAGLTAILDERERTVIAARYGFGCRPETLREVSRRVGVSPERVRQIQEHALDRMRAIAAA